jgi:hypothetical protein
MTRVLVWLGVFLGLLLLLIAGLLTAVEPDVDVPFEIARGLITLAVAVLVTGVLSFVLAERNRELAQHEERVRVLVAARQDFKTAYGQVHVARFFLGAHPSAKTLDEQIGTVTGARERFQHVQRERSIGENKHIEAKIQDMLNYLKGLTGEYRENFLYITQERLVEEAEQKQILEGHDPELKDRSLLPDPRFAHLAAFVSEEQYRSSDLFKRYNEVKKWLEKELSHSRPDQGRAPERLLLSWGPWFLVAVGIFLILAGIAAHPDIPAAIAIALIACGSLVMVVGVALPRFDRSPGERLSPSEAESTSDGIEQLGPDRSQAEWSG